MQSTRSLLSQAVSVVSALSVALSGAFPALAAPPVAPQTAPPVASPTRAPQAVTGIATVGATGADYATLQAAFQAINTGVLTGSIQLNVIDNTTEITPAVLFASNGITSNYTSVLVQPVGGAWLITSTVGYSAGLPLIDLNGADNVTFDGLNTGGNALTIANASISALSGTSTIRFIGGATNNTLTNLTILGAASMAVGTNGATIFFSTDANTPNGNDNNTIANNNIGPISQTALPTKAILSNGSTSTTAIGNSAITINNNNIYDYFGAAVTSSGVATNGGSNTWIITNNRFYQTAPRTWTTGANHRAIDINNATATSGAQGFTITGNTIGYASAAGTGTYVLTGSTGKFQGIQFSGITGGALSTISNNTIAAVSLTGGTSNGTSTSSPFMGILISNGRANTNNNTLGSQTVNGSLVFSTTTTTATDVHGIYNFSLDNWTATGNTLGGLAVTNTAASGTFIIYGLRANTGTGVSFTGTLNFLGGTVPDSIQLNATGTASQIMGMQTSNAAAIFISNTIRNLSTNIGTGTTTAASVIGINVNNTTPNHTLSQNTIYNLTNSNPLSASVVTGIQFTGGSNNVVERNLIYGLNAATNSASAEVNGIRVAGGTTLYRNNMIAIGAGITNALGAAASNGSVAAINGINEFLGTNQFFHNSVYIGGVATAGSGSSFAFNGIQTVNTRSFRNNIFFNARTNSGATGKHYAIKINGTAPNPTGLTLNNNVYFANGTGAVLGFFNSLDVATLAAWRTAVGQDTASIEADPQYLAPTAATPDLHISAVVSAPIEANGFLLASVTDDFDGETRSALTPVDIGADAGNFIFIDLAPPAIGYIPFGNTSLTTDRVLVASLTDITGVPTSGPVQPRLYFNKNGGAWASNAGVLASGTGLSGTWNFVVTVADVGGVTVGDVISYFVVAQDTAAPSNLGSFPAGVNASDVNTIITAPVPFTYTVVPAFSGSYNVGASETYTSLTNAGGIFQAINASALTGDVVINITSDLTGETGAVALNQWAEDGVGGYSLTLRPSGAPRTITGTGGGVAVIRLNGADRVTIDGALTTGGTDRSLTVINPNPANGTAVVFVGSQGPNAGANNFTLRNTVLQAGSVGLTGITTFGVFVGLNTGAAAGPNNNNLSIINNEIRRASLGIQVVGGANPGEQNLNTRIEDNLIGNAAFITNSIRTFGMLVSDSTNGSLSRNIINNVVVTDSGTGFPTGIGIQNVTGLNVTQNTINNVVGNGTNPIGLWLGTNVLSTSVLSNTISGVRYTGTGGYGGKGIDINTGNPASNLTVANNMVSDIRGDGWNSLTGDSIVGIRVGGTTGGVRLYHNSVNLGSGAFAGNTSGTQSAAMFFASTTSNLDVRNNLLATNLVNTAAGAARSYAIATNATTNTIFANINHNLYYTSGTQARVGLFNAVEQPTLAAWQTVSGQDASSLFGDPAFVSATDLHLLPTSPALGAGVPVAGLTTDIDGDTRLTPPSIGADEGPLVSPLTLIYNDEEDAVGVGDTLYVDGLPSFGSPLTLTADGGATTFSVTLALTRGVTYQYKYVVNTFDGYGYDLLNNPAPNRVLTFTTPSTRTDYRRISQYDYYALLSPASASITVGDPSPVVLGETFIYQLTAPAGAMPGLRAQVGFGNTPNPATWTWVDAPFSGQVGNNDQFSGVFTPTLTGVYSYAVRFNANWGAGNPNNAWVYGGLGFAPLAPSLSNAGVITVTAPAASITVTKTVGLAGSGCATSDFLVVAPGTEVDYCFTVQNTGVVTFNTHTLTDTLVGVVLSGFPYTLTPGASVFITTAYTHTAPGLVANTATWEASDGVVTALANDSASVLVADPALVLTKTVSAGTCASAADTLTVTLGAVVNYCFTVQNTGNLTLTDHTLTDPLIGLSTSFPLTLPPGAVAGPIAVPFTTTASGTLVNTASFTATNGAFSASDSDSATLNVTDQTLAVSPASLTSTQPANTQVTQTLTVSNTGTLGDLTWTLAISGALSEGFNNVNTLWPSGWFSRNNSSPLGSTSWFQGGAGTTFGAHQGGQTSYVGANFNATTGANTISNWLLTPPLFLRNGAQVVFWTRTVTTPFFADRLQVRLSTNGASTDVGFTNSSVGDFGTLLLDINPTLTTIGYPNTWTPFTVTISGLSAPTTGRLAYRYFVTNGGPSGANSDFIGIDTFSYNHCVLPSWASVSPTGGSVAAGAGQAVNVVFDSTGLLAGTYTGNACFTSNGVGANTADVPLTLTVPVLYGVAASANPAALTGAPGSVVTYTVRVTNTGNTTDTLNLSASGAVWTTTLSAASVTLAANAGANVVVSVTVPGGALAGASDVAALTATSAGDAGQSASVSLTTTAGAVAGIALSKTVSTDACTTPTNTLTVTAGAVVDYCFTVENTGNVTLTTHTLDDAMLGLSTTFPLTLTPGMMAGPIAVPYTASVVGTFTNTATFTATNGVNTASASDSATLVVEPAFVPNPSIIFTKTVSTDACTTPTNTLTVTAGAVVDYCFTVENTGNVTLTTHTLDDAMLGLSTTFPLTLTPGMMAGPIAVPYTASVVGTFTNTATFTATNGVNTASASASAVLVVEPAFVPNPSIIFTKTVSTDGCATSANTLTVTAGAVVDYCFTVENTGNVTLTTHTLDDAMLGLSTTFPLTLTPGMMAGPIAVPYTASVVGTFTNTATFTATNGVNTASASDSATLVILPRFVYLPLIRR